MTSIPPRLVEALEGRYRIERQLGEGGMATVYLAEDLKHRRSVALKVLKPELAAVVGAERFLSEIQTTANLQHPNILPLYDSGEADSFLYYVMPYVEGETLRERLATERQLPVDEAVRIATAVANALDFAHRHGVVHRDIKPANILFQDGQPVVGDFGIALAVGAGGGARLTETGLSVGTPYYMSPEQATGDQHIGPRSDIYSLGCVLYEMLTGDPPYMGSTAQAVLGQIIAGAPVSVTTRRTSVPTHVDAALRCALAKLPADRFGTAQEMVAALENAAFRYGDVATPASVSEVRRWKRIAAGAVAGAVLLAAGWAVTALRPAPPPQVERFRLDPRLTRETFRGADLSPDGSRWVFGYSPSGEDGETRLWTRTWNDLEATAIPGTEGGRQPVFSPDGERVAFMAGGDLKTVDLAGTAAITVLADARFIRLDWGPDGFIYGAYSWTDRPTLWRVPEGGGAAETVTSPPEGRMDINLDVLPGGRGVLFARTQFGLDRSSDSVGVHDAATAEERLLVAGGFPLYSPSGHLLYLNPSSQLMAVPFDLERLEVVGAPVVMVENVDRFRLSESGDLMYGEGSRGVTLPALVWRGRDSSEEDVDWPLTEPVVMDPALSPDGRRLAVSMGRDTVHILVKDLVSGTVITLLGDADESRPAWSSDGRDVAFFSRRVDSVPRLWKRRADGSGRPVAVSGPFSDLEAGDLGRWAPDRPIVMGTPTGLVVLRPGSDSVPSPLLEAGLRHENPTLSPDGRWVAFEAGAEGEGRVFVRPFPEVEDGLVPISVGIGFDPQWSRDGKTLYYVAQDSEGRDVVAARLRTEPDFQVVDREVLAPYQREGWSWSTDGWLHDVAPDGERVLMVTWRDQGDSFRGLVLVKNFVQELRERVGGGG